MQIFGGKNKENARGGRKQRKKRAENIIKEKNIKKILIID